MPRSTLVLPILLTFTLPLQAQFALTFDGTVPVIKGGNTLAMPWAGAINFSQWSNIDLDLDGDLDLFVFDRSGNKAITLIKDGAPGTIQYHHTNEFDNVYPLNELHDWALLRDYNCDGKPDIWSYSLGGARVFKNTSDVDGLSFELVDTLVRTNYQPTDANLFITQVDIPGIEDIDNDGDLDLITFSIFGSYLEYHRNLSMELYGTCDSLTYEIRNRCWGYFSEDVNTNSVNLDDTCTYNVPNPELPPLIEAWTATLRDALHQPASEGAVRASAHVGSTILPIDLNGDTVKDLLLGDVLFSNVLALYNNGTVDDNHMASQDTLFPSYDIPVNLDIFPACYYVDVDGDGRRDLIVGPNNASLSHNYESVWYYHNNGTDAAPIFSFQDVDQFQEDMLEFGEGAYPVTFDVNGDGLMDLIVSNYGYYVSGGNYTSKLAFLRNNGTASQPSFIQVTDDYEDLDSSGIGQAMYPAFGDIDNDGDKDMYIGNLQGQLFPCVNTPSGGVADFTLTLLPLVNDLGLTIDVGMFAKPQFFDVDGDGKLDLLVGERNGNINYYHNTGTSASPTWHLENDSIGGVVVTEWWNVTGYSAPFMFINGSGERELVVGSQSGWFHDFTNIDGNIGGTFTLVDSTWQDIREGWESSVALYDFNNDGYLDAVTGNMRGGVGFWRNDFAIGTGSGPDGSLNDLFVLAPNPAGNAVQVMLDRSPATGAELMLIDALGRIIVRMPVRDRVTTIHTQGLSNGCYTVRMSDRGSSASERLVILH